MTEQQNMESNDKNNQTCERTTIKLGARSLPPFPTLVWSGGETFSTPRLLIGDPNRL